jgi:chemotaxis protein methyltransferase CheR
MSEQLNERDYQRLAGIIQDHTGIRMPSAKRVMVEGRLRRRLRALDISGFDDYCRFLFERNGLESEFVHLIDAVTTNKTDFFREPNHFDFLRDEAVPALLAAQPPGDDTIRIWSAACSTGAEAYTIAMVLADLAKQRSRLRFSILGTDISTVVLKQAATAVYPAAMADPIPPEMRRNYIMEARDKARCEIRVVPEIRRLVRFRQLNLMDERYPVDRDIDVIFLRNVLIYFDKPTQHAVLERLCGHLRPGGFLILGHSESMAGARLRLRQVVPTIFRRE